uniref:Uncharacterized protein n=1 Tax=Quercus lobata TaxID=97700 RepID=A0A7N2L3Z0_QUELO
MTSVIGFWVLFFFVSDSENKYESRVQVRSLGDADSKVLSSDSVVVNPLWNDGYWTETVRDLFVMAKDIVKHDGGLPRWFCPVSCGRPLKDSPIPNSSLFAGMDVTGLGLVVRHKALGKCALFSVTFVETYLCCTQWLLSSGACISLLMIVHHLKVLIFEY